MAEYITQIVETVNCPACGSGLVGKVGVRNGQQRFRCRDCKKVFRNNGKKEGHQFDPEQIGIAIRHYYMGLSYKQIAEAMEDLWGIPEPAKDTIYQWVAHNTDKATRITREYPADVGKHWVADEIMVRVGGEWYYHWNVMDYKTRFLLASHLSKGRGTEEAETVMHKALRAARIRPTKITTDGYIGYASAIASAMPGINHEISEGITAPINNNRSERLQGTIRDRDVTLRGLDGLETGQRFLDGWRTTYNFFREHEALGFKTPAEVANVEAPITDWADVVRSDVEVPKRKPVPQTRKDSPSKDGVAKKRKQRQRRKAAKAQAKEKPVARGADGSVQLNYFNRRRPTEADRRRAASKSVQAPRAVMPEVFKKPQTPSYDTQMQMLSRQTATIPKRMRPRPPGRTCK